MKVDEFIAVTGISIHALSQGAEVSYPTLYAHVKRGAELGLKAAKKLEAYDARLNAAEILGLASPPPKAKRGKAA